MDVQLGRALHAGRARGRDGSRSLRRRRAVRPGPVRDPLLVQTNRRIFRGMIRFQDNDRWHSLFGTMLQNSRWVLPDDAVESYLVLSFDYVVDYLVRRGEAIAAGLDPIGDENLGLSKRIRRLALKEGKLGQPDVLFELADNFFPLPDAPFRFLRRPAETEGAVAGGAG
jgi:hypothetical protein